MAHFRLFGADVKDIRVTLFRDNHAWCPYCQKVWLFLEMKRVPYRVRKVTMFCYGKKEKWYTKKVPSGMLPAVEIDGKIVTESDDILLALENTFGTLHRSMRAKDVVPLRRLERYLFRVWCNWLCYPARDMAEEARNRDEFVKVATVVDDILRGDTSSPFFLDKFSVVDCVFVPYLERMSASLFYYKGFTLRDATTFPGIARWFDGLEQLPEYRGTQSDFHTHVHDLPPQMGGCYEPPVQSKKQVTNKRLVDEGPWNHVSALLPDSMQEDPGSSRQRALARVILHKDSIVAAACGQVVVQVAKGRPDGGLAAAAASAGSGKVYRDAEAAVDEALRCALTLMMTGAVVRPAAAGSIDGRGRRTGEDLKAGVDDDDEETRFGTTAGIDRALRYIRDRVNVPRDMPLWSARHFRTALETTAALCGNGEGPAIPHGHRMDQNPIEFHSGGKKKKMRSTDAL